MYIESGIKNYQKILIALLVIIAIPLIVALFVPKDYKSEREIIINKPKQEVFNYIRHLKNQDNFGVWQQSDPDIKTTSEGTDGTVGFKYSWDSKKLGKGAQVITNVTEGERVESDLFFLDFGDDAHHAFFSVEEKTTNETLVKWGISGKNPYPWNLMSLFFDMGKDFEQGLKNLKEILEIQKTTTMKKLQFIININAPAEKVYNTMLGKETYEQWTAEFNPTSTYEGNWTKDSKILFVGTGEDGNRGGMVAEIAENIPNKFVSIRHLGILEGDKEITEGSDIEKWANNLENYTFEETSGVTTLTIDVDTPDEYAEMMSGMWERALEKLKEIAES